MTATPDSPEEVAKLVAELKRRGNLAFKAKSYFESEILYSKALEHEPKADPALYGNRSAARIGMQKFQEALTDADEAVKLGWNKGHFRRGQALAGLGKWRDSQKAYETCYSLDTTNVESKREAERMKNKADEVEADQMDIVIEDQNKPKTRANKEAKSKPNSTEVETTEDDDIDPSLMRGYKTLENGRKTTYFHREISPEEKAKLAQANKPTMIDSSNPSSTAVPANSKEGSAWNAAGTFEERDMTKWATDKIKELVKGTSTVFELGDDSGIVEATDVANFDGVASVSFIRGSRRHPFDFTFNVEWTASIAEGEFSGKLFYSQFSSDDDSFENEIKWENREKAGKAIKPLLEHLKREFSREVDVKLQKFIEEFNKL